VPESPPVPVLPSVPVEESPPPELEPASELVAPSGEDGAPPSPEEPPSFEDDEPSPTREPLSLVDPSAAPASSEEVKPCVPGAFAHATGAAAAAAGAHSANGVEKCQRGMSPGTYAFRRRYLPTSRDDRADRLVRAFRCR
jgi:hypothetical protein